MLKQILHVGLPSAGKTRVWMLHYMVAIAFIGLMGEIRTGGADHSIQLSLFIMLFGDKPISIGNERFCRASGDGANASRMPIKARHEKPGNRLFQHQYHPDCSVLAVPRPPRLRPSDTKVGDKLRAAAVLPSVFLEPGRTLNIGMVNASAPPVMPASPVPPCSLCGTAGRSCAGINRKWEYWGSWIGFLRDEHCAARQYRAGAWKNGSQNGWILN